MAYRYFPSEFSSYEDYVEYLKEKGLAFEAPEEKNKLNKGKMKVVNIIVKALNIIIALLFVILAILICVNPDVVFPDPYTAVRDLLSVICLALSVIFVKMAGIKD